MNLHIASWIECNSMEFEFDQNFQNWIQTHWMKFKFYWIKSSTIFIFIKYQVGVLGYWCQLGPAIAFLLPNVPEGLPTPFLHKLLRLVMQFYHEIVITTNLWLSNEPNVVKPEE
jgi:hypothetical protein